MRIRFLFVLVAAAVTVGTALAQENSEEDKLVKFITTHWGKVERDESRPGRPVVRVSFDWTYSSFNAPHTVTSDELRSFKIFENLRTLDMLGICSPPDLDGLSENKNLTTLNIKHRFKPNAAALKEMSRLPNLTTLNLEAATVNDGELTGIGELKHLTSLSFTEITDDGVKQFAWLTNLTKLNLSLTMITHIGFEQLKELRNLKSLIVSQDQFEQICGGQFNTKDKLGKDGLNGLLPDLRIVVTFPANRTVTRRVRDEPKK